MVVLVVGAVVVVTTSTVVVVGSAVSVPQAEITRASVANPLTSALEDLMSR
jgi:hypothetical protein